VDWGFEPLPNGDITRTFLFFPSLRGVSEHKGLKAFIANITERRAAEEKRHRSRDFMLEELLFWLI
jgi:hypothetical protein